MPQGDNRQDHGDDQANCHCSQGDALAPLGVFAACQHILPLQSRRLGFFLLAGLGQPCLRFVQLAAAQSKAGVAPVFVPCQGAHLQPGVRFHPGQIGLNGSQQFIEGLLETGCLRQKLLVAWEEDPVQGSDRGWQFVRFDLRMDHDRYQPFLVLDGVLNLFTAHLRVLGVVADDVYKVIRCLDGAVNLSQPIHRRWDVLPVDPGFQVAGFQRVD